MVHRIQLKQYHVDQFENQSWHQYIREHRSQRLQGTAKLRKQLTKGSSFTVRLKRTSIFQIQIKIKFHDKIKQNTLEFIKIHFTVPKFSRKVPRRQWAGNENMNM